MDTLTLAVEMITEVMPTMVTITVTHVGLESNCDTNSDKRQ